MTSTVVPFCGKSLIIDSNSVKYKQTIQLLTKVVGELTVAANKNKDWSELKNELTRIAHLFLNSTDLEIPEYKIDIMNGILPYIQKMQSRYIINKTRFTQVQSALQLLFDDSTPKHPSEILVAIDNIVDSINSEGGFWQSDFALDLRKVNIAMWQPILSDNRRALQNIGMKLGILGVVAVVRPIIMLWPLYLIVVEVIPILRSLNQKKELTQEAMGQLLKTFLILTCAYMLSLILAGMSTVGYGAIVIGGGMVVLSTMDVFLKSISPSISPLLVRHYHLVETLDSFEMSSLPQLVFNPVKSPPPRVTGTITSKISEKNVIEEIKGESAADCRKDSQDPLSLSLPLSLSDDNNMCLSESENANFSDEAKVISTGVDASVNKPGTYALDPHGDVRSPWAECGLRQRNVGTLK